MKILVPIIGFGPSGGFRVLSRLATEWQRAGHAVTIVTPVGTAPPYHPTEAAIRWVGPWGPVLATAPPDAGPARLQGIRNVASVWNGVRQLGAGHDVILANHCLTSWPIWLGGATRAQRFYYIQADEAENYRMEGHPVKALLARGSYALPFAQIVNAPVYPVVAPDTVLVPPGIDLDVFTPKPAPRDFGDGAPIVLGTIGRHEPSKGTRYALAAFEALAASDPRYRLSVAYGNLPEGWSHQGAAIHVPRGDAELAAWYRSVDILLAPGTVQHGAPHYPVMEALASATPVVTTGYMPADAGNSWLVANRDSAAIAAAVRGLVADPGYHARVEAGRRAIAAFAWPAVAARMAAIFATGARP